VSGHEFQIVLTTCGNAAEAEELARVLVEENLAACVNTLPGVNSIYRWQGEVETAQEYLLLIKSLSSNYDAIEQRIRALHTYELPEIIAVPIACGLTDYLNWIKTAE